MPKKELREFTKKDRRDFGNDPFDIGDAAPDPIDQFARWYEQAIESELPDPYAFTLATAAANGSPSVRTLYMRDFTKDGITFFTNYNSTKGQHLAENSKCAANFLWLELNRQVRVEGRAEKISPEESDAYFASRPRESQIGAWASDQSSTAADSEVLSRRIASFTEKYKGIDVPRPPHWGGYIIIPSEIEFWQGRPSRLHDRICYRRVGTDRSWEKFRRFP